MRPDMLEMVMTEGERCEVEGGYVGVEDGGPVGDRFGSPEGVLEGGGGGGRGIGFWAGDAGVGYCRQVGG